MRTPAFKKVIYSIIYNRLPVELKKIELRNLFVGSYARFHTFTVQYYCYRVTLYSGR